METFTTDESVWPPIGITGRPAASLDAGEPELFVSSLLLKQSQRKQQLKTLIEEESNVKI